ncbi:LysR family transcriptional regulator [Paenibacillus glycanilyticus]|uniref:LysR family transcriptional regulator n=1 Tax=Paenibacillus glycanilyticus TaxID=126569 RepID=A0ABQ6NPM3_9BACL|nr:LysR family transcriptional regulator [Paenibacillus glycanilyticus]GMK47030.1 LysR family transcriptional regulator [Paenibacillus glycanilyticus]
MDIENMMAFVTVAELKSVSAAASNMNHLQSNMTAKIKKIENHYRQQLFFRSSRGMELTPEGEKLYRQYKKLLLLWEETEQEMNRRELKLRLGIMQSVISENITKAFTDLYEKYPNMSVTLITGSTEKMEEELIEGNIDLAYTFGKSDLQQLHYWPIGSEELVLVGKRVKTAASLAQCLQSETMLILSKNCLYASILQRIYSAHGSHPASKTEVGVLETLLRLASLGMGVALVSKTTVREFGVTDFMELPQEYRYIDKFLVTRTNYELSPLERQFFKISQSL